MEVDNPSDSAQEPEEMAIDEQSPDEDERQALQNLRPQHTSKRVILSGAS